MTFASRNLTLDAQSQQESHVKWTSLCIEPNAKSLKLFNPQSQPKMPSDTRRARYLQSQGALAHAGPASSRRFIRRRYVVFGQLLPRPSSPSDRPLFISGKLGTPDCQLILPIAPNRLFVAVNAKDSEVKFRSRPEKELVESTNIRSPVRCGQERSRSEGASIARNRSYGLQRHAGFPRYVPQSSGCDRCPNANAGWMIDGLDRLDRLSS